MLPQLFPDDFFFKKKALVTVGAKSNGKFAVFTRYKSHLVLTFAPMVPNGCSGKDCVLTYHGC